jgi:hypothetical protein
MDIHILMTMMIHMSIAGTGAAIKLDIVYNNEVQVHNVPSIHPSK